MWLQDQTSIERRLLLLLRATEGRLSESALRGRLNGSAKAAFFSSIGCATTSTRVGVERLAVFAIDLQ